MFLGTCDRTVVNWDHFASLASLCEDSVSDNIDEEYDRLIEHLYDCATKAESLKETGECRGDTDCKYSRHDPHTIS
ncbi:unnamed protein product [Haemonchus placei]|uniref:DUF19 domain-containing protein n=1 Tax=Haemonchus placei TaxID=6290 RepID=A0A0N4WJ81_HAEPC|nr:unnamed protein product [Haemonchus placei]